MAISSGLGATGSGVIQLVIGSTLFSFCLLFTGNNPDIAWRLALVFPALLSFFTATFFYFSSEDCPLGNHNEVKNAGLMIERSAMDSFRSGALNLNSWILFLQ
jgi:NNP family nitrate/nitrite transporter-like MFS transporter